MWAGCRIPFAYCLLPAVPFFLCGCFGRNYVEPDYRFRDDHLANLRSNLYTGEFHASARHREEARKPEEQHVTAYHKPSPLQASQQLVLTASPLAEQAGALEVIVQLRDGANRSLRVPASLHVSVQQVGPGTQPTALGDWELPPDLLEHAWTASWSGGGYRLILPWKASPGAAQVRVVARLTAPDGTPYDAEQHVSLSASAPEKAQDTNPAVVPVVQQVHSPAGDDQARPASAADTHWGAPSLEGALKLGRPVPLTEED